MPETPPSPLLTPAAPVDRSRRPDPGSPGAARVAWLVLVVSFLLVAGIQAMTAMQADQAPAPAEPPAQPTNQTAGLAAEPPAPIFEMVSKVTIATATNLQAVADEKELSDTVRLLAGFARTEADKVRVAILAAEIGRAEDPRAAVALDQLKKVDTADPSIGDDVWTLTAMWTGQPVTAAQETLLVQRYGFFGELALARSRPEGASAPVIDQLSGLLTLFSVVTLGGIVLLALGVMLLVILVAMVGLGKFETRFVPPTRGGSVYLEAAAVFVAGFLVLKGVLLAVAHLPLDAASQTIAALGLQWLLLAAVLWPLVRGEKFHEWCLATGWHRGAGLIKEVACGVAGWIAAVPLFIAAGLISAGLVAAWELIKGNPDGPRPLPDAAIFDLLSQGNTALIVAVFALGTIWAPLAEESIFRGCLYRHLRGRLGIVLSSVLVASVFGFMHGYGVLFVPPVIALGFAFSIMREWRGSIIAPVTAHLLHNATLITFMILMTKLMG